MTTSRVIVIWNHIEVGMRPVVLETGAVVSGGIVFAGNGTLEIVGSDTARTRSTLLGAALMATVLPEITVHLGNVGECRAFRKRCWR
jgi:hypothetical protein